MVSSRKLDSCRFSVNPPSLFLSSPPPENSTILTPATRIEALVEPEITQCFEALNFSCGTQDLAEKTQNYLPHKELLEIVQRLAPTTPFLPSSSDKKYAFLLLSTYDYSKLEEPNVDNMSVDSLISLEGQLENTLSVTRARKTELMIEFVKDLEEKEKLLREENQVLRRQMGKKTFLVTEDERGLSPENISNNTIPETLPLLK